LPEDLAVGICMSRINATFVMGVDDSNRLLFTPIQLDHLLNGEEEKVNGGERQK
jgi:hypothetical protein